MESNHTTVSQNTVKEEILSNNEEIHLIIKNETEELTNPFSQVQLQVKHDFHVDTHDKQEFDVQKHINNIDKKEEYIDKEELEIHITEHGSHKDYTHHYTDNLNTEHLKIIKNEQPSVQKVVKEENECILPNNDDMIMYEYPSFDDSMDSSEATALSKVEACLTEEVIKPDTDYDEKASPPKIIKEETELTVTETHIISNKVINTTSTITNTVDGVLESQTTKTIVMEIHPVSQEYKIPNPEEILPTSNKDYDVDYETFQLNSITGNYLSLEQEAYKLLEKKTSKCNEKLYECDKCPKTYKGRNSLKQHEKVHFIIEKRARGVVEGMKKRKENRDKLKEIKEIKQSEYQCEMIEEKPKNNDYICSCGQIYQRRSRMETCLRSHSFHSDSSKYNCTSCNNKFDNRNDLICHRNRKHRKKYPCKFCPTNYNTQKELFKHLQIHQKVQLTDFKIITEITKRKQELKCLICLKTCASLSELKTHTMEDHQNPYSCPHCRKQFTKITDFINHMKKNHSDLGNQSLLDVLEAFSELVKAWKCEDCGLQFYEAEKLAIHEIDGNSEFKNDHFQCEDCQRVFINGTGLKSHRRIHHLHEEPEEVEPEEIGVMCLECRKICKDMAALTSHMRLHSMDRKYPCKYCDFRFATPQKRKTHSEIHTGDMKYVCFICEYTCSSENRLKHHKMSLKHLNMKEYLLTGKPLIPEETAKESKKIKDTSKKKKKERKDKDKDVEKVEVTCDICGDKFSSEKIMVEHKQTHPFIEFPNDDTPTRIFFK